MQVKEKAQAFGAIGVKGTIKSCDKQKKTQASSGFSLDVIIGNSPIENKGKFGKVQMVFEPGTPVHRRQPSVVIRNLSEIYSFDEDFTDESIEEENAGLEMKQKTSAFVSTIEPKSSLSSAFKKSCLENEFYESVSLDIADIGIGGTKPDEQLDTFTYNTVEGVSDFFDFGIIPCIMYCDNCMSQVNTEVRIKLPTLPFWKLVCCLKNIFNLCENNEAKYQEFEHICTRCSKVLAVKFPNN